jgi:hypothetical protein
MRVVTQTRFEALADRDGFVVVYGNAAPGAATVPERPNGGGFRRAIGADTEVDDLSYLRLVIEDLVSQGVITGANQTLGSNLRIPRRGALTTKNAVSVVMQDVPIPPRWARTRPSRLELRVRHARRCATP